MTRIVWFRQDLRLHDNPALYHACQLGDILPIYIYDTHTPNESETMGGASQVWLHHGLRALNDRLQRRLCVYQGKPEQILFELVQKYKVKSVHWNRCYEPWQIHRDTHLKKILPVPVHSYNGYLLWEPWTITKVDKTPYMVFTPFYNKGCLMAPPPDTPLPMPPHIKIATHTENTHLTRLDLLPITPEWHTDTIMKHWHMGENYAYKAFEHFLKSCLDSYKHGRDVPSAYKTSRLAPHIHFGEISVRHLWHETLKYPQTPDRDMFLSELGWREFAYNQLYYNKNLPTQNIKSKFNHFAWRDNRGANADVLYAWQRGLTGIPMVDAGMRELWHTGYVHNRVRMIVGSFLVKNLMIHWRYGERWFWDCLCDADMASNSASWQWVAGCGLDASPFFRIFNPVTQGQKFDPDGIYIRHFIPELADLPDDYIHAPWTAPDIILRSAKVVLGGNYPKPIVDLKYSRQRALDALNDIKGM